MRLFKSKTHVSCSAFFRTAIIVLGCALTLDSAVALSRGQMTESERALLPKFCERTQGFDQRPTLRGHFNDHVTQYGVGWTHLHHYCWALASMMRANSASISTQERTGLLTRAIADIDYVLKRTDPEFVLWFTIMHKKFRALMMLGKLDDANEIGKAVTYAFPDRADAYRLLAEVEMERGNLSAAKNILVEAESKVKDTKRLAAIKRVLKIK